MRGGAAQLLGRRAERDVLDRFLAAVRVGESRTLVVRGEPGVGKTALLKYLAGRASGCQVAAATGVQSEMELAFAGLHQLLAPMLDRLERLPGPQRDALRTAFGMSAGPVPDRFLVGLAVLGLLSEMAAARPLVCLVDDEQWLDHASAQILAFVARRLGAEAAGLVFGARVPSGDLAGLPELVVGGLREDDARALLGSVLTGPMDERVRDQIVAETRGNPLALLELPRGLTAAELAGGFGLPGALSLPRRIEESFRRRVEALPARTRLLLLLAAAEPIGDPVLLWRAAGQLGIGAEAAGPAAEAGLAEFGARVRFRHPLVRSAAYRSAALEERQQLHRALAKATDPAIDPDRRAWHRAHAAPGPDEDVAAELERSADRVQARGGLAAAAAFLERATVLTPNPAQRAGRALAAAQAKVQAGGSGAALDLLAMAEAGPLSELQHARVDLARAQLVLYSSSRWARQIPAIRSAAASILPGTSWGRPARRRPSAARRPSPEIFSMLSSSGETSRLRTLSARPPSSATYPVSRAEGSTTMISGTRSPSPGRRASAGTGRSRSSAVLTSANTCHIRSISGVFANLANLDFLRKLLPPSGASSTCVTTWPKVAAQESKTAIPAASSRSGRR